MNLAALMSLGPLFEMFLGSQRLLVLFTGCGLAGSVASALYNPDVGNYRVTLLFIRGRNDERIWPDIEARIAASLTFEEP